MAGVRAGIPGSCGTHRGGVRRLRRGSALVVGVVMVATMLTAWGLMHG